MSSERAAVRRRFLMCSPVHFAVEYAINAWMTPGVVVDTALAVRQWEALRDTYRDLGHEVFELQPVPGLPDLAFAANGAFVVDGRAVGARFAHPERAGEAPAHAAWLQAARLRRGGPDRRRARGRGRPDRRRRPRPRRAPASAPSGAPTPRSRSAPVARSLGLDLVDPRFYHLDTALFPLDDTTVAWFPGAFSPGLAGRAAAPLPGRRRGRPRPTRSCSASTP